jgi:hypothetical protein
MTAAPKKGVKSLNTKKSRKAAAADTGKRPAQGDRKAQRKRIILSNDNALEVSGLTDLNKDNVLSEENEGKVMGLPQEHVVDALRAVEAFKTTQGWSLFRRPAVLMRKEAIHLAKLFKEVEDSASGQQKKTLRRILCGERMSGKSTLLLQGLAMAFLRDWFVINLPEGRNNNSRRKTLADHLQPRTSSTHIPTTLLFQTHSRCSTPKIHIQRTCSNKSSSRTAHSSSPQNSVQSLICPSLSPRRLH